MNSALQEDIMDFLIEFLFRGLNACDNQFGYTKSTFFTSLTNEMSEPKLKPGNNLLHKSAVFMPICVDSRHWVLAVLVNPFTVFQIRNPHCCSHILYLDPLQKHRLENNAEKLSSLKTRSHIHKTILNWMNLELCVKGERAFTERTYPMKYDFGNGEFLSNN